MCLYASGNSLAEGGTRARGRARAAVRSLSYTHPARGPWATVAGRRSKEIWGQISLRARVTSGSSPRTHRRIRGEGPRRRRTTTTLQRSAACGIVLPTTGPGMGFRCGFGSAEDAAVIR